MATYSSNRIRQGLPRTPGGPAWPDVAGAVLATAGAVAPAEAAAPIAPAAPAVGAAVAAPAAETATASTAESAAAAPVAQAEPAAAPAASGAGTALTEVSLRRGLPRTPGGEPWPPAGSATVAAVVSAPASAAIPASPVVEAAAAPAAAAPAAAAPAAAAPADAAPSGAASDTAAASAAFDTVSEEVSLRQGLPRVAGGDPWPPAATVTVQRAVAGAAAAPQDAAAAVAAPETPAVAVAQETVAPAAPAAVATPAAKISAPSAAETAAPAANAQAPAVAPAKPKREAITIGSRTLGQWVKLAVLWGGGAIFAAAIIVLAARGLTTLPGVPEFLKRYPGEYHLPEFVDPGFPVWARWSHFLNFFLMVLIIRSGLLVRKQQKPDAFFTPKKGGTKVSIYLWLHTSLDILWLANGVVFVVLLFVSGHWARIVPTSWEVFPNALSAMIQYLTLDWPVENGWVNYNSLQQLMYFTVVFIAAPLAAITGVRMSEWWPKNAEKLNKFYPAPVARAIHFPVMLFFVLFILIHVFLVLSTGALRNLNHMFAGTDVINWVGFAWFAGGLLLTAAVTWAARPLVLAPIAGAFGRVSER
ncbi:cytochrome b/b6 domain-containing protein [Leucobacter sp. UT-8R-CII-1-4]|uniref:cytochrome b/b6 domain-containing protein n=1 Tax=Leucobacter sp. UT-8R-CII-1-4 TaxID=3040075 RepID=UPI0024A9D27F|nr:cytochrome b/b6 domain-containing protein [Leucobacter sp. UT-8R-CII-1-4]MDI6022001.1 cytochrome b/b6 domain-containing protein [Leucobacter sp. UT-8R-CII-1-4]